MKTRSQANRPETETRKRSKQTTPIPKPKVIKRPPVEVVEEIEIVDSDSDNDSNDHHGQIKEPPPPPSSTVDFTETDPTLISTLVKEHCIFCLTRKTRTFFSISNTAEVTDGHELLSHYFGSGTADSLNDIFDAAVFTNKRLLTSEFPAPLLCENCVETLRELDNLHKKLESLQRQILLRIRKVRQRILDNGSSILSDGEPSESRLQFESELLENCHGNEEMADMVLNILDKFQEVLNEDTADKIEIHLEHLEKFVSFASDEDVDFSDCRPSSSAVTVSTSSQTDCDVGVERYRVHIVSVENDEDNTSVPTSSAHCGDKENADTLTVVNELNQIEDCKRTISKITVSTSSQTDNDIDHYNINAVKVAVESDEDDKYDNPSSPVYFDDADNDCAMDNGFNKDESPGSPQEIVASLENTEPNSNLDTRSTDERSTLHISSQNASQSSSPTRPEQQNISRSSSPSRIEPVSHNVENPTPIEPVVPQSVENPTPIEPEDPQSVENPTPIEPVVPQNVENPASIESVVPQNVENTTHIELVPPFNVKSPSFIIRPTPQNGSSSSIMTISSPNTATVTATVQQTGNGICIVREKIPTSSNLIMKKAEENSEQATHHEMSGKKCNKRKAKKLVQDKNELDTEEVVEPNKEHETQEMPEEKTRKGKKKNKRTRDECESNSEETDNESQVSSAESELSREGGNSDNDDDDDHDEQDGTNEKKSQRVSRRTKHQTIARPFKCSLCKQRFVRRYDVYRHIRTIHHTEPILDRRAALRTCTECDFSCNKTAILKAHMWDVHKLQMPRHLNNRTYECDLCGYSKDGLKLNAFLDHLREHEDSRKSISCDDCLQKFTTKQMYQMHPCPQTGRLPGTGIVPIDNSGNIRKGNEYKCRFCGDSVKFHSEKSLQTHFLSLHAKSKPFPCEICGGDTDFKSKNCLKTHMIEAHDAVKYKCRICEVGKQEFKSDVELHMHMSVEHFGGHIFCPECPRKFTDKEKLEEHALTHAHAADIVKPEKIYICEHCALPFRSTKGLRGHKAREHGANQTDGEPEVDASGQPIPKRPRLLSPSRPATYIPRRNGQPKPFVCSLCDYDCCTFNLHRRHMQIDHGILLEKQIKTRTYECETCDYTSSSVRLKGFVMHLEEHEDDSTKKFCCEDCFQFFTTKQMYQYHSCPQTGKLPGTATVHVSGGITKEKEQYPCMICKTVFGDAKVLQKHSLQEHNQNAFLCDLCEAGAGEKGAAFASKNALKTHRITTHGAVPYKCRLCVPPKDFSKFDKIFTHYNITHFECFYPCPQCPKRFAEPLKLENHLSSHSDARTHICTYCGAGLKTITTLRRHIQLNHTEEGAVKQHICEYCSKGFKEKSNLKKHIQIHERNKQEEEEEEEVPARKKSPRQRRAAKQ